VLTVGFNTGDGEGGRAMHVSETECGYTASPPVKRERSGSIDRHECVYASNICNNIKRLDTGCSSRYRDRQKRIPVIAARRPDQHASIKGVVGNNIMRKVEPARQKKGKILCESTIVVSIGGGVIVILKELRFFHKNIPDPSITKVGHSVDSIVKCLTLPNNKPGRHQSEANVSTGVTSIAPPMRMREAVKF